LQAIFHDQDIAFEIVVGQKNGKVWIDFETLQNGVRGQALQSFGGGVASVESLLLRLLVLLKTGLSKYLILDESLAALSEHYVDEAGQFIRRMSEELGVNVLLITHNKAFLDHAHTAYQAGQDFTGDREKLTLKQITKREKADEE
jgi:ABC-type iron transport system FetAB ATPase subunit